MSYSLASHKGLKTDTRPTRSKVPAISLCFKAQSNAIYCPFDFQLKHIPKVMLNPNSVIIGTFPRTRTLKLTTSERPLKACRVIDSCKSCPRLAFRARGTYTTKHLRMPRTWSSELPHSCSSWWVHFHPSNIVHGCVFSMLSLGYLIGTGTA